MIESERVGILLVEDDDIDRMAVQRLFAKESLPYDLVVAGTVAEATSRLREGGIGLVLIDHRLPDGTGLDVQKEAAETPNIFITAADDLSIAVEAMKAGAADFLVKDSALKYLQLLPLIIKSTLKQEENVQARRRAEEALQKAHDELHVQVRQRTAQLVSTVGRLNQEIEERKRLEEDLQDSEQRYRSLIDDVLDTSATGIFILDAQFKIVWISQAIERYFGLRREEVVGKDKRQVIRERIKDIFDDPEAFVEKVFATYQNNAYVERFECHVLPDGQREERWLEHRSLPIRLGIYAGGRIESYYDITERVAAERALETHARQQEVVAELGRYALKGDDLADVMNGVVRRLAETLGVEYCNVLELLPDGQALLLLAGVGWNEGCVGRATVPCGQDSQAGYTLLSEGPVVVEDLRTETRFSGQPLLHDHGVVSGMCVIVQGPQRPWGVLGAHSTQRKIFSKNDVNFLRAVANLLADAIARKHVEEELAASETNYHEVFNTVNDMIVVHEKETGAILDVNDTYCRVFGYTRDEARQLVVGDFSLGKPPYTQEDAARWIRKAVEEGPQLFEWLCKKKSGELFWVEVNLKLAVIGGEDRVLADIRDISERKRAEEELGRTLEHLSGLYHSSKDAIGYASPEGFLQDANEAFLEMTGYSKEELIQGKRYQDITPEEYEQYEARLIKEVLETGKPQEYEKEYVKKDGSRVPVLMTVFLVRGSDGRVLSLAAIIKDLTERKRAEEERENLIMKLESQNAELERFTYTVSHDLKSPLITLKGYMGVLKEDLAAGDGEAIEHDVARMASAADKMGQLLNELLELSRIGRVVNQPEDVALGEIVRDAMELVGGRITREGTQVEIAADMPIIFGDRRRLVEVLQNLIENAVKWTADQPEGRIEIRARQDNRETVCYVRDNGTGIDPRHHEKIFGLFEKLDPRSEGSGVGLALVKRIIEVHGGRIWVESEGVGRGSTFCFTLPQRTDLTEHGELTK